MEYYTVKNPARAEFVEKKSRFIAHIKPVLSEQAAIEFINQIKKEYSDASHNVYAYSIRENQIRRYSDDREPQGTAGLPVLELLAKEEIVDAVIVVTRYFGGKLLGTGGLVRAYSEAARLAVSSAGRLLMRCYQVIRLVCDYSSYQKLQNEIVRLGVIVLDLKFGEAVEIEAAVLKRERNLFCNRINEIGSGKIKIEPIREEMMGV